jgi:hypothetical protein
MKAFDDDDRDDISLAAVLDKIQNHQMTRKQRGLIYDALADLIILKYEEWLLENQEYLAQIEEKLQLSLLQEIGIRLLALLVFPLTIVVWLLCMPIVLVVLLLNVLTCFQSDYLFTGMVVSELAWEASGALVLGDFVGFFSPVSGIIVMLYNAARICLQKDIRGELYNHGKEPLRKIVRAFLKQVHYMYRRHEKGLYLFKHGPFGDGKELYEGEDEEEELEENEEEAYWDEQLALCCGGAARACGDSSRGSGETAAEKDLSSDETLSEHSPLLANARGGSAV